MSIIALGSFKNAPGVTSVVTGLAATWPTEAGAVIVEADTAGGDIGPRFGLNPDTGVASLAAAARRSTDVSIADHFQLLPGGVRCLFAPVSSDHARVSVNYFASSASRLLRSIDGDVLIDCGQLISSASVHSMIDIADHVIVCVRPELANLSHVLAGIGAIRPKAMSLSALVIGDGPYSDEEIASALDMPILGRIPSDRNGAAYLGGAPASDRAIGRSPLVQACRNVSKRLIDDAAMLAAHAEGLAS